MDSHYFADFRSMGMAPARSHDDYLNSLTRPPPLATIIGFHIETIPHLAMHVLPLGVCQWAAASAMLTLCAEGVWGLRGIREQNARLGAQLKVAWVGILVV